MDDLPPLDLTECPDRLARDVENVRRLRRWIVARARLAPERLLALIPAGPGSQPLLNASLPKLLADAHALGLRLDVVLGLNDDTPAPDGLERLRGPVEVVHLWTAARTSLHDLPLAFACAERTGAPATLASFGAAHGQSRIHAVHQARGRFSSGVLSLMGDLHALVLRSVREGWSLPSKTLRCDAESHFVLGAADAPPDLGSNGLALLLATVDEAEVTIACANSYSCTYSSAEGSSPEAGPASHPDLDRAVAAPYRCLNVLFGTPGFELLTGAGFAGESPELLATTATIYRTGHAAQVDDVLIQVLANASGFGLVAPAACRVTNRVPPSSDREATRLQLARWVATGSLAHKHYGVAYFALGRDELNQAGRRIARDPRAGRWTAIKALFETGRAAWLARGRRDWLAWR